MLWKCVQRKIKRVVGQVVGAPWGLARSGEVEQGSKVPKQVGDLFDRVRDQPHCTADLEVRMRHGVS